MYGFEQMPGNPADLAAVQAEESALTMVEFEITRADQQALLALDHVASELKFIGQKYFVESRRSLSIPVSFEADEDVSHINFMDLTFEGTFACYSKVVVGRILGHHSVRALCLTFHEVTLLPFFDGLPDDHLLHVPVLAVATIGAQAA